MPRATEIRPNAVVFGQIIRRHRLERGWTVAELARQCEMHHTYLAAMEKGANTPSLDTIFLLAMVFGADPVEWVREIKQHWDAWLAAPAAKL